ncbi:MAG: hypothetical protein K2Y37_01105 [Pirellulales bacterium]|nr:hypothetical protein [Pirellulales bacterium]
MSTSNKRDFGEVGPTTHHVLLDQPGRVAGQCEPDIAVIRTDWHVRLPRLMQPFLTWLSGYPYAGQKPFFPTKPWWVVVLLTTALLGVGLCSSFVIVSQGGYTWFGLPIAWLLVVGTARTFQVFICHQGVHDNLSGDPAVDRALVEVISTVLVVQNFDGYQEDHKELHHPQLASDADVDRKFIIEVMRLEQGVDAEVNRRLVVRALLSPRVHAVFLLARVRANVVSCPAYRRAMTLAWWSIVALAVTATQTWLPFFIGCVFPMTVLYHMSAMCQFVTEHFWTRRRQPGQSAKQHYFSMLVNRHLGDPLPACGLSGLEWLSAWTLWWARLYFYHAPFRLAILVGDLPVHGSHHLWPLEKRWTEPFFTFQALAAERGTSPIHYVGGYRRILHRMLESFNEVEDSAADATEPITLSQAVKVANGM